MVGAGAGDLIILVFDSDTNDLKRLKRGGVDECRGGNQWLGSNRKGKGRDTRGEASMWMCGGHNRHPPPVPVPSTPTQTPSIAFAPAASFLPFLNY